MDQIAERAAHRLRTTSPASHKAHCWHSKRFALVEDDDANLYCCRCDPEADAFMLAAGKRLREKHDGRTI